MGFVIAFILGAFKKLFSLIDRKKRSPKDVDVLSRTIENIKLLKTDTDDSTANDEGKEGTIEVTVASSASSPAIVRSDQIEGSNDLMAAKEAVARRLEEIGRLEKSAKTPSKPQPIVDSYTSAALDHAKQVVKFSSDSFVEETPDMASVITADASDHNIVTTNLPKSKDLTTVIASMKGTTTTTTANDTPTGAPINESLSESSDWDKIKSAGQSGIIAYVLTELAFWAILPVCVIAYQRLTGESVDLSQTNEQAKVLGLSAGVITVARAAVPARIALSLSLIPFVEANIAPKLTGKPQLIESTTENDVYSVYRGESGENDEPEPMDVNTEKLAA